LHGSSLPIPDGQGRFLGADCDWGWNLVSPFRPDNEADESGMETSGVTKTQKGTVICYSWQGHVDSVRRYPWTTAVGVDASRCNDQRPTLLWHLKAGPDLLHISISLSVWTVPRVIIPLQNVVTVIRNGLFAHLAVFSRRIKGTTRSAVVPVWTCMRCITLLLLSSAQSTAGVHSHHSKSDGCILVKFMYIPLTDGKSKSANRWDPLHTSLLA
jgi:hypothetical protein